MHPNEELELKMLLSADEFASFVSPYPQLVFKPQHNVYFESHNSDHYAFRIRYTSEQQLFTLKQKLNDSTMEYEKPFSGDYLDDEDIISTLESFSEFPPFIVMGELLTLRAIHDTGKAEMCFDINFYNGVTDYEIEYEVYEPHDHVAAFTEILKKAGLEYRPNHTSKYKRCKHTLPQKNK